MTGRRQLLERQAASNCCSVGSGARPVSTEDVIEVLCTRRLDHRAFSSVQLEATYVKSRADQRVVYESVVVARGIDAEGDAEVLGVSVGDSERAGFWGEFLLSLRARGLHGVELLVAEEHGGLEEALTVVFPEAAWQCVDPGPVLVVSDEPFAGENRVPLEWRDAGCRTADPTRQAWGEVAAASSHDGTAEPLGARSPLNTP